MPTNLPTARFIERIEAAIHQVMDQYGLPGLAVGMVKDDALLFARGYGVKDITSRAALSADSLFHMASISKPFVCTGILQLATYDLLWGPRQQTDAEHPENFIGLSWFISQYRGYRTISHSGGDVGFNTYHVLLPEARLGVVVLANSVLAPVAEIGRAMLDHALGFEPDLPRPPAILTAWQAYAQGGRSAAAIAYRHLQQDQPQAYEYDPYAFADAGYLLAELKRYPEAIEVLQLGAMVHPEVDSIYS